MKRTLHPLLAMAAAALMLAACGGKPGNETTEEQTTVPASATSSTSAWVNFAKALMSSESSEALSLTSVATLPTSESEEPQSLGP